MAGIELPTKVRFMTESEYTIVKGVMGDTLPSRYRIWLTDACGERGRAFTIPTSLISTILSIPVEGFFRGVSLGYLTSFLNLAYLINVGSAKYDNMASSHQNLLVHETMHVWQGHNSTFALSYVFNSIVNQCLLGQAAYNYTLGDSWSSYNAEQQAKIVEDWFARGGLVNDPATRYILLNVQKGDA